VPRPRCRPRARFILSALALASAVLFRGAALVEAQEQRPLQLEVYVNGAATNVIGAFVQIAGDRMATRRSELAEVGIRSPDPGNPGDLIVLNDVPGLAFRYDEAKQAIFLTVDDARRIPRSYDAGAGSGPAQPPVRSDYGSVVNYSLFAVSSKTADAGQPGFSGANGTFDARLFGPLGTFSQTGIVGTTPAHDFAALRLETTWTYSDPASLVTYRAGDAISGGLAWTRPIRLGGAQMQRNFALRPDLVTLPLPSISGSAAVPSTVDVYLGNTKTYSQEVGSGPYQITNVPMLSGAGTARIVVRDSAGRPVETMLPFFTTPKLLKEGLWDFSVEAGLPRLRYGIESNGYADDPVGSASLRGGMHDWLTLEAHAEGAGDLRNAGAGALARVGSLGIVSAAGSASQYAGANGFQSYLAFDSQVGGINVHASSQRTFGTYQDLASVTARYLPLSLSNLGLASAGPFGLPPTVDARAPKALDALSFGLPLPFDKSRLGLSYLHLVQNDGKRSDIINLSYSRSLPHDASFYATAFMDVDNRRSAGIFLGVSVPLDGLVTASSGVSRTPTGSNVTFDAAKSMQPEPGSYGWRVRDSEGATPVRLAGASYRSSIGQIEGNVEQVGKNASGWLQADGAVTMMRGGIFMSNRINDSFAVVDAGAPNVEVFYENRPAGTTDANGRLLIPNLRSFQSNTIAIDPRGLPLDADAPRTQNVVAPADRAGVVVDFGVRTDIKAAVVIFTGSDAKFLAPGSPGRLEGSGETFVVGYDGRAYIKGLEATNAVAIGESGSECRASFAFAFEKDRQAVIGPVVCR
jgi:outer membrane usher protein